MSLGKAEAAGGVPFGVEVDEHRRLVADHPGVVAGLESDHRRCLVREGAAVGVGALDVPARKEANVGVLTCAFMCVDHRKPGG